MRRTYARLLARCDTVNQINRVHIALGNRMSPLEFHDIRTGLPPRSALRRKRSGLLSGALRRVLAGAAYPPESHEWVEKMSGWMDRSGKPASEKFARRRVRPNVVRYSDGSPAAAKALAICFTGGAGRLFMPIPVLLQHLSAARFDLLVLRDPTLRGYRSGLSGVSDDFCGLVDEVAAMFDRRAYRSVVTLGTSGGGLPAVVTAVRLGLDKAVCVGGRDPLDPGWQAVGPGGVAEILRDRSGTAVTAPNVLLVHGADDARDAQSARTTARFVPASTVAVRSADGQPTGHNPLFPLLEERRLGAFLESALDPDVIGFGENRERVAERIEA